MISIFCVGFASLDVDCDELNDCAWNIGLYEVPSSMLGFGMGTMFANFHMCGIMLVLRAIFNMLVWNASQRGHMCFRCLVFNLSGHCELLYLLCFIASWT